MKWYLLTALVSWPVLNILMLVVSWITGKDIGFIFYFRLFFTLDGPYDLVLSDFFNRFISSLIVLTVSGIVGGIMIWIYYL